MPGPFNSSFFDALGAESAKTKEQEKAEKLQQRLLEKQEKLTPYNTSTAGQLQKQLSDMVDAQVYTRDNGSMYQLDWQPTLDATGNLTTYAVEKDFDPGLNTFGSDNLRNLYIDDTEQGNYKLGLAATDVNPEFISPWTGKPITPYEARYLDKQGVGNVYLGSGRQYDGTPGPMGVTPQDGSLLDITLPGDMATQFEYDVHSNLGQMRNRAIGEGAVTQEDKDNFGDGKTEYTTANAPMWNMDYVDPGTVLDPLTPLPKDPNAHWRSPQMTIGGTEVVHLEKPVEDTDGYLANLVDGVQGALGSASAKAGDLVGDFVIRSAKEIAEMGGVTEEQANARIAAAAKEYGLEGLVNNQGNFIALDKYKEMSEYGYDGKRIDEYGKEFKKVIGDENASFLAKALVVAKGIQHFPEVLATSAGEVMLAGMPGGMAILAASTTNDFLEERVKTKGTSDLGAEDYIIAGTMGVIYASVNQFTKGMAGLKPTSNAVKEMVQGLSAEGGKAVVAKLSGKLANGAFKGSEEGVEEIIQGGAEVIGTKLKTSKEDEILTKDTALDLALQGTLGAGAGVGSSVAGDVLEKTGEKAGELKDIVADKVMTTKGKPTKKDVENFNKSIADMDKVLNPEMKVTKDEATGEVKEEPIIQHTDDAISVGNKIANNEDLTPEEAQYRENNKEAIETYLNDKKNLQTNLSGMHAELRKMEKKFTGKVFASEIKSRKAAVEAKMAEEGMQIPSDPVESEGTVTEEELTKVKDTYADIKSKGVLGNEDMERIVEAESILERRIEELRESDIDTTEKEKNIKGLKDELRTHRTELAKQLDAKPVDEVPTFGSKEAAEDYIESILSSDIEETSTLTEKLDKIAKEAGIDEDMYKAIRKQAKQTKDWYSVGVEAKDSSRGYRTQGKVLRNLLNNPEPDIKQVKAVVSRMQEYAYTQKNYADTLRRELNEVETKVNTYNAHPSVSKIPGKATAGDPTKFGIPIEIKQPSSTQKWTIYVTKGTDGKLTIAPKSRELIDEKLDNYTKINEILEQNSKKLKDKAGLDVADTGIKSGYINIKQTSINTANDAEFFEKHGVTKVITPENEGKWTEDNYKKGNEGNINTSKYSADDVVLVSVPYKDTKTTNMKTAQNNVAKYLKNGPMDKMIASAQQAKATLVIDPGSREFNKEIRGRLATYGYAAVKEVSGGKFSKQTAKATTVYKLGLEESNKAVEDAVKKHNKTIAEFTKEDDKNAYAYILGNRRKEQPAVITDRFITDGKFDSAKYDAHLKTRAKELIEKGKKAVAVLADLKARRNDEGHPENDPLAYESAEEKEAKATVASIKKQSETVLKKIEELVTQETAEAKDISEKLKEYSRLMQDPDTVEDAKALLESMMLDDTAVIEDIMQNSSYKGAKVAYRIISNDGKERVKTSKKEAMDNIENGAVIKQQVDISEVFNKNIVTNVINSIPVFKMGPGVVKYLEPFKESIKKTFADITEFDAENLPKDLKYYAHKPSIWMSTNPARGLVYGKDPVTGKEYVNENVALAMRLVVDEFIALNGRMLDDGFKSDDEIAQMLNIDSSQVTREMRQTFSEMGMLKKSAANSIGKAILSKLGLTKNKDIDAEIYNKIAADIGNMAIFAELARKDSLITLDESMTSAKYATALGLDENSVIDKKAIVKFIKLKPLKQKDTALRLEKRQSDAAKLKDRYEKIAEATGGESAFRKEGKRSPIKNSPNANTVAKTQAGFKTSKEAEEVMENLRATKWRVDIKAIKDVIGEEGSAKRESLKAWLGYTESAEDLAKMSKYDADGQISKNRDILKSIDELERITKSSNTDEAIDMYFDWFYSSNGRYMMDSNTLNPQTDKLHRFLIQPADHTIEITKSKDDKFYTTRDGKKKDITSNIKYALAQAFGYAVDKKSTVSIMKVGEAILASEHKELLEILETKPHTEFVILDGKVVEATKENLEAAGGDSAIKLEVEHISHTYQALDFIKKASKSGKFTSSLTAETDAVTSGFALKLFQMPILGESIETTIKWLQKTGVFLKGHLLGLDTESFSMNDVLDDPDFFDSYQTLAKEVTSEEDIENNMGKTVFNTQITYSKNQWNAIRDVLPSFDKAIGEVTSELRSLFKDPFMTFNYSAGMQSIRKSLTNVITNKLVTGMINNKDGKYSTLIETMMRSTGYQNIEEFKEDLRTANLHSVKKGDRHSVEAVLNNYIDSSYGIKVQEIMKDGTGKTPGHFANFTDAHEKINNAFKAMFAVFNVEYNKELAKLKKDKREITDEDKLKIIDSLRERFPAIRGPLSDNERDTHVSIIKTGVASPAAGNSTVHAAQTYLKGRTTDTIRHEIREFEEAISSGSVVPIHYIDAAIMGKLYKKYSNFTAIHDAIMMPIDQLNEGAKAYNKLYMEIGSQYSFVEEIGKQLDTVLDGIDLKDAEYEGIHSTDHKGVTTSFRQLIETSKKELPELVTKVKNGREELIKLMEEGGVYVAHMASLEDGVYSTDASGKSVKTGHNATNPTTATSGYPAGMSKLEQETNDAILLAELAGVKLGSTPTMQMTSENITILQDELLRAARYPGKITKAAIKRITKLAGFLSTDGHIVSEARKARATKHASKYGSEDTQMHLLLQMAEELNEVIEEKAAVDNVALNKDLLEIQYRAFKVVRFGEDVVNKSTKITNAEQLKNAIDNVKTKYKLDYSINADPTRSDYLALITEVRKSLTIESLGATQPGEELNEVYVTTKEFENLKVYNQSFKDKYPEMFTTGDEFRYFPETNTITVMEVTDTVTPEMVEVYTAHEIKHALTYQWIENNKNKASVKYLENAIEVANRKLGQIPFEEQTELLGLLKDRIQYAKDSGKNGVAELVAILSSEPNIRKEFMKQFPQQQKSRLKKILDAVAEFLGFGTDKVIATVDAIVAAGKIEDVNTDEFMEIYQEIGERNKGNVSWQQAFTTEVTKAAKITSGLVSELNTAKPRHVRAATKDKPRKDSPITITRISEDTVWATYPDGKQEYALPINEVTLDQNSIGNIHSKYTKEYQTSSNTSKLAEDPFLFNTIKERLLSVYPEITAKKVDSIVTDNGMAAVGSAIGALVEYTENASVDTLPHEYAHIYINLLESTTFMRNTINSIKNIKNLSTVEAKEYLATKMGEGYVTLMEGKPLNTKTIWTKIADMLKAVISPSKFRELDMQSAINEVTTRLFNGTNSDGIRLTPKKGTKKVDPTFDFDNQPFSAGILKDVIQILPEGRILFTGSEALAMQGDIYRSQSNLGTDLHDLDFAFNNRADIKVVSDTLKKKGATQIYDFEIPVVKGLEAVAEKVMNVLPIASSVFVPLGKIAKVLKVLPTLAVETFIMAPNNLEVKDIKRYKNQKYARVISYNLRDSNGNVKGTYSAEVEEVNRVRTKIVSETTTGEKAVIVDLLEDKNRTDNFVWKYDGVNVTVSSAEDIFTAKNKMAEDTPRDKDVIDANSFYNRDFTEESLGAAFNNISTQELAALKVLNDTASSVKAKESGIIPMIARGKAIKEARSILEKAMKDCKGS